MAQYKFVPAEETDTQKWKFVPAEPPVVGGDVAPIEKQIQPINQGDALSSEPVAPEVVPQIEPKVEPVLTEPKVAPVLTDEKIEREPVNIIEAPLVNDGYSLKDLKEKGLWQEHVRSVKALAVQSYRKGEGEKPDADGNTRMTNRLLSESVFDSLPLEQRQKHIDALNKQKYAPARVVSESGQLGGEFGTPTKDLEKIDLEVAARMPSVESAVAPEAVEVKPGQLDVIGWDQDSQSVYLRQENLDAFDAMGKGFGVATETIVNLPTILSALKNSRDVSEQRRRFDLYTRLDNGEDLREIIKEYPSLGRERTDLRNAGLAYLNANPELKAKVKQGLIADIGQNTLDMQELLPKMEEFYKNIAKYKEGIPDLTKAKNATDVANAISFYAAMGLELIVPVALSASVGGQTIPVVGGVVGALSTAVPLNLSATVGDRYNHLIKMFKNIKSDEEKAEAMIQYLEGTKDETLITAITNSFLDTFLGPVGGIVKARYLKGDVKFGKIKETGVQVGEEFIAGFTQDINQKRSQIKLKEAEGPLFSRENLLSALESGLAEGVGAGAYKGVEIVSVPMLKDAFNKYSEIRGNAAASKIINGADFPQPMKEYVQALLDEGTSPLEALTLAEIHWGQKSEVPEVEPPSPEEFVEQTGIENSNAVSFLYRDNELQDDVKRGTYTKEEAATIAARAWVLINDEDVPPVKAFSDAKKIVVAERPAKAEENAQTVKDINEEIKQEEQEQVDPKTDERRWKSWGQVSTETPRFLKDIPSEEWLQSKKDYVDEGGRDEFGRPTRLSSSVTGSFVVENPNSPYGRDQATLELPVSLLKNLPGFANEQIAIQDALQNPEASNHDTETLAGIASKWDIVRREPISIRVDSDGNARVYEGNHRLAVAVQQGETSLPVHIMYHAVDPDKVQAGFTPEELLAAHKEYNKGEKLYSPAFRSDDPSITFADLPKDPVSMPAVVRRRARQPISTSDISVESPANKNKQDFDETIEDTALDAEAEIDALAGKLEALEQTGMLSNNERQRIYRRAAEIAVTNPGSIASQVANKILDSATAAQKNLAFNQAKTNTTYKKFGASNLYGSYQTEQTGLDAFGRLIGEFVSPNKSAAVNSTLRASEALFSPKVKEGIRAEWQRAYEAGVKTATPKQRKILEKIPAAINGDETAQQEVAAGFRDGTLTQDQYELANPSQWWASNANNILNGPLEQGSWQADAAREQKSIIDDMQNMAGLDPTDPFVQAINKATNNPVVQEQTTQQENAIDKQVEADTASTPTDGTTEELATETIEPTPEEQQSIDEAIDAMPSTDSDSKLMPGYAVTERSTADQDEITKNWWHATRDRTQNLKVIMKYFNVLSDEMKVKLLALLQTADVHRLFRKFTWGKGIFGEDDADHIANIIELVREMNSKTRRWLDQYKPLIAEWSSINGTAVGPLLAELMNESTKKGVDVTKQTLEQALDPTAVDPNTGEVIGDVELVRLFKVLEKKGITYKAGRFKDEAAGGATVARLIGVRRAEIRYVYRLRDKVLNQPNGQQALKIYDDVKRAYRDFFDSYERVIKDNIKNLRMNPEDEQRMLEGVTARFNLARANIPVYFRLSRRGDYFLRIKRVPMFEGFYQLTKSEFEQAKAFVTAPKVQKTDSDGNKLVDENLNPIWDYEEGGLGLELSDQNELSYGDKSEANYQENFNRELVGADGMLLELFKIIETAAPDSSVTGSGNVTKQEFNTYVDEIKSQIGQAYLSTLPGNNVKTMFFKRKKNRRGESLDVLAAFGETLTSIANQFPRITHAPSIKRELAALVDQTRNLTYTDDRGKEVDIQVGLIDPIIREMRERIRLELSPNQSPWARYAGYANKLTFMWLLSAPKSAMIQTTQFPIVVMPLLAQKYGTAAAVAKVAKFTAAYNKLGLGHTTAEMMKGNWAPLSILNSGYMKGHKNKEAMQYAWAMADTYNMFDVTYAADIGNISKLPSNLFSDGASRYFSKGGAAAYTFLTGFFSVAERMTREMTYMSTFELAYDRAKGEGLSEQDARNRAVNEAMDMTYDGLFDYTRFNKARITYETAPGQLLTQFMSYSIMMSSLLVRNSYNLVNTRSTLQERKDAAKALGGILLQTGLYAGLNAVWLGSILFPLLYGMWTAVMAGFDFITDDEDDEKRKQVPPMPDPIKDPKGYKTWYDKLIELNQEYINAEDPFYGYSARDWMNYQWLPETFGPGGSVPNFLGLSDAGAQNLELITKKGIPGYFGWDLSTSLSLDNMLFEEPMLDPNNKLPVTLFDIAASSRFGAPLSAGVNILTGIGQMLQGEYAKGLTTSAPAGFKGGLKAYRVGKEGLRNYKDHMILAPEYFTLGKKIQMALGIADPFVSMLTQNNYRYNKWRQIVNSERQGLIGEFEKRWAVLLEDRNGDLAKKIEEGKQDEKLIRIFEEIDKFNQNYMFYGIDAIDVREALPNAVIKGAKDRLLSLLTAGILTSADTDPAVAVRKLINAKRALGKLYPDDIDVGERLRIVTNQVEALGNVLENEKKNMIPEKLQGNSFTINFDE